MEAGADGAPEEKSPPKLEMPSFASAVGAAFGAGEIDIEAGADGVPEEKPPPKLEKPSFAGAAGAACGVG